MQLSRLAAMADKLEESKKALVAEWVQSPLVEEKFKINHIGKSFFARHFGIRVVDHMLKVIRGDVKPGYCPVITVMLMFFKEKNIPLSDIFIICSGLRQRMVEHLNDMGDFSIELYREISFLIDKNFEGVIAEYFDICLGASAGCPAAGHGGNNKCSATAQAAPSKDPELSNGKISAAKFWELNDINSDDVDELRELAVDVDQTLGEDERMRQEDYEKLRGYFGQYARIVNEFYEFKELGYSLSILTELLENTPYGNIPEADNLRVQTYFESIMHDLNNWCQHVFITRETEDVHYLDDSLLSSIAMLEAFITNKETEEEELELF